MYLFCAQASQAGGNYIQGYAAPLTHVALGLDLGALLRQVSDSVHIAILSCMMERPVSILRTSQSGRRHLQATLRNPKTHAVLGLDVGALVDELTQLRHVTSLGGVKKLFVHLFLCLCSEATLPHEALLLGSGVSTGPRRKPVPTQCFSEGSRTLPRRFRKVFFDPVGSSTCYTSPPKRDHEFPRVATATR